MGYIGILKKIERKYKSKERSILNRDCNSKRLKQLLKSVEEGRGRKSEITPHGEKRVRRRSEKVKKLRTEEGNVIHNGNHNNGEGHSESFRDGRIREEMESYIQSQAHINLEKLSRKTKFMGEVKTPVLMVPMKKEIRDGKESKKSEKSLKKMDKVEITGVSSSELDKGKMF